MSEGFQEDSRAGATGGGGAFVVHPEIEGDARAFGVMDDRVDEAAGLVHAIHLDVVGTSAFRLKKVSPGYLIGKGKREEIAAEIALLAPDVVIVNHTLSPVQQRNLEKAWKAKVLDRTGLILEIFGERAQTREGRIQVDLAALEYQKSRLVRSWTHLERQRGGAGFMGGPGETQIEMDRRIITDKIAKLRKDLEQVRRNRDLQRRSRERVPYPIVALVGYTNAGKSTLFNRLTGADVFAQDLLFATLDPTMRRLDLPGRQEAILADTVGFIADLPTHLVAAFRATLEQVVYADIILHVRDMARPDADMQKEEVVTILGDLGIDYGTDARIIEIWNKVDLLEEDVREDLLRRAKFGASVVAVSALNGDGADDLLAMIAERLAASRQRTTYRFPVQDGQALAWLYQHARVLEKREEDGYIEIGVEIDPANAGRFHGRFSYSPCGS